MSKKKQDDKMPREFPIDLYVSTVLGITDYFTYKSKVIEQDHEGSGGIAIVLNSGDAKWYVTMYYGNKNTGWIVGQYCKRCESMFEAMVIYKKFKTALHKGYLEKFWQGMKSRSVKE